MATNFQGRLKAADKVNAYRTAWFENNKKRVQSGEPFAICNGDDVEEVFLLMDIPVMTINNWNYSIIYAGKAPHFTKVLHERDYPGEHMLGLGFAAAIDPKEAPWGGLPKPSLIVGSLKYEFELRVTELWARQFGCPVFPLDFMFSPPFKMLPDRWWSTIAEDWESMIDPHRLELRVEQEKALIAYLEQTTGRSFDATALRTAMERVNLQMEVWHEAQAMIAATRPCPVSIHDQMSVYQAMWHRGTEDGLRLIEDYRDEIAARVKAGIAGYKQETFRLFYNGRLPPWHDYIADKFGAVTVAGNYAGIPDLYARKVKGDPLRAMASRHLFLFAQGPGRIVDVATQHQCDGIIIVDINQGRYPSAEQMAIEAKGVPFLAIPRDQDDDEVRRLISDFIETKLLKSESPR